MPSTARYARWPSSSHETTDIIDLCNDGDAVTPGASNVAVADVEALFPNSFKVTGIKHICDNLVAQILENLPQWLGSLHLDF